MPGCGSISSVEHVECCDLLAAEVERFADVIDNQPLGVEVPSCPGWSLGDLTTHLGLVHRWAEHLVRARAQERIPADAMSLGQPVPSATWLRSGGQQLVATLRSANPDVPMWAWGADQHVRFWSRRQLHETLVHRMDAELALGREPAATATVAADAIDEFLVNLARAARFSPNVKNLHGSGTRLLFLATDVGRSWWVTLQPAGFEVRSDPRAPHLSGTDLNGTDLSAPGPSDTDATLAGPAVRLLLVLYRRLPVTADAIDTTGERAAIDMWLANSALE